MSFTVPDIHGNSPKPFSVAVTSGPNPRIYFTTRNGDPIYAMDDMAGTGLTSYGNIGTAVSDFQYPLAVAVKP